MTPATFPGLLESALRGDPSRPLVTFYDDATGERVELSVTTYANWVAKAASLLQDELDVGRGATALLQVPPHWLGAVWLGALWSVGAAVTDDLARAGDTDVVVRGADEAAGLADAAVHAGRVPVLAVSLRPLAGRFTDPLPDGVVDAGTVVLGQPDAFTAWDPPTPGDPAWTDADGVLGQGEVAALPAPAGLAPGGRLLTDLNPASRAGLAALVAPLRDGGGTVWVRRPAPTSWGHRREVERAGVEVRAGQPPRS